MGSYWDKSPRRFRCGPDRSYDFKAGHRMAMKGCNKWLENRINEMNDPKAKQILRMALHDFGLHAKLAQQRDVEAMSRPKPKPWKGN